jgi:hypothetical protein
MAMNKSVFSAFRINSRRIQDLADAIPLSGWIEHCPETSAELLSVPGASMTQEKGKPAGPVRHMYAGLLLRPSISKSYGDILMPQDCNQTPRLEDTLLPGLFGSPTGTKLTGWSTLPAPMLCEQP